LRRLSGRSLAACDVPSIRESHKPISKKPGFLHTLVTRNHRHWSHIPRILENNQWMLGVDSTKPDETIPPS
jgi:hypothetical protein